MKESTKGQFDIIINYCRQLFLKKNQDYGTSWRILRLSSITDQIYIKALRIRSIQEKGVQKINEDISDEFIAIINYCIIAMIQIELELAPDQELALDIKTLEGYYDRFSTETVDLMMAKNHDYGEAWRDMRVSSITDIILMKLLRVKQIEDNQGATIVSEGIKANYQDMLNYSVFCLILSGKDIEFGEFLEKN